MPAVNRYYSSVAIDTTLKFSISSSDLTFVVESAAGFPTSYPYTLAIGYDSSSEELVTIVGASAYGGGSGNVTLTVGTSIAGGANIAGRGVDGTSDQGHTAGEVVKHVISARDMTEAQAHIAAETGIHGLGVGVSPAPLASPTFTGTVVLPSTTSIGSVSSTEIGYLDGVTSAVQTQLNTNTPVGMISPYAGSTSPTGWLLCNGAAVSRTTYASLFTVTSTTYGAGDGTTTFNVPDLRGRTAIGAGTGTGLTARTLGATTGVESVTLTAAQSGLPAHTHTNSASTTTTGGSHGHGVTGSVSLSDAGAQTATGSIATGGHGHTLTMRYTSTSSHDHAIGGISNPLPAMEGDPSSGNIGNANGTAITAVGDLGGSASVSVGNHNHTVTNTMAVSDSTSHSHTATTTVTINNNTSASASESHDNMQPSLVLNYIIKH
jgi:microcystin-dependent protein